MTPSGPDNGISRDTPLMRQYSRVKSRYPDSFVLFRLGDFYELFGQDAIKASAILGITLTSRDKGPDAVPLAGVPHHSVMTYVKKLIDEGHTVVMVDQVEDPRQAKGIVKREVTRVISPGTVLEDELLTPDRGNALGAVCFDETASNEAIWALCVIDVSQGTVVVTGGTLSFSQDTSTNIDPLSEAVSSALNECERFPIREILIEEPIREFPVIQAWKKGHPDIIVRTRRRTADDFWRLDERLRSHIGLGVGIPYPFISASTTTPSAALRIRTVAVALEYVDETNPRALNGLDRITSYEPSGFLSIDPTTTRNLEIFRTLRTGDRRGSLSWAIDRTITPGGRRLLSELLALPLSDPEKINNRHESVQELFAGGVDREDLSDSLKGVRDIARLSRRISAGTPKPIDVFALARSLENLPSLKTALRLFKSDLLVQLESQINLHEDLAYELKRALDPDSSLSGKDGYIRPGFDPSLDELRTLMTGGRGLILSLQASEREQTGIKNLKVGFNRVFGYYIEITKSNIGEAPDRYIRKQTLTNCERYITQELKDLESKVLGAEERARALEEEIFLGLVDRIRLETGGLAQTAGALAMLDVLLSFARIALEQAWIRPELSQISEIRLAASRHPVLEQTLPEPFIPNDVNIGVDDNQLNIITGPNMAGKSTYMRQIALAILLNQIGSFVPAQHARLGVFDKLFSRVGATDDLALGQSTFMVEMLETAHILHSCTSRSLVILDEIGRGTSTFDGLAIAWSVAEYLSNSQNSRPITLFATHYHELTRLADEMSNAKNWRITLQERAGDIIFLRKVVEGRAGRSYGIQVAKLAGLPSPVIERANEILKALETQRLSVETSSRNAKGSQEDNTLFLPWM